MLPALILTALAQADGSPVNLQALVATSGNEPAVMLDGDASTSWRPGGDASGEGVLFRFEVPTRPGGAVTLAPCEKKTGVTVFVNGVEEGTHTLAPGGTPVALTGERRGDLRTLFLRIDEPSDGACLGDVRFGALTVKPPRVVKATVTVSSVLQPADAYHPGFLFDGRLDFGWVEGSPGPGTGESVTLTLDGPAALTGVELWNGYQRSDDHFVKNARIRRATVTVGDGPPMKWALSDVQGPQTLSFKPVTASRLTLTIDEVYPGKAYRDLVVSELRLKDAAGPLAVATPELTARARALAGKMASSPLKDTVDKALSSVCGDTYRARFRTDATFVVYRHEETDDGELSEVMDGAWILKGIAGETTTVELFGRSHRTEAAYDPYAAGGASDTTRIIGGPLKLTRVKDLGKARYQALIGKWKKTVMKDQVDCTDASYDTVAELGVVVEGRALTALLW